MYNNYYTTVLHCDYNQNDGTDKFHLEQPFIPSLMEYGNFGLIPQMSFFNLPMQNFQQPYSYNSLQQLDQIEVKVKFHQSNIFNSSKKQNKQFIPLRKNLNKNILLIKSKMQCVKKNKKLIGNIKMLLNKQITFSLNQPLLPKTAESERQLKEESPQVFNNVPPLPENLHDMFHTTDPQNYFFMFQQPAPKLQVNVTSQPELTSKQVNTTLKKPKKDHINTGHWSAEEHQVYITFLAQYESVMTSSLMKKSSKIFKQMADKIGTRTPSQCRSHHQKFNPYASKNSNRRLLNGERGKAGRKKKIIEQQVIQAPQTDPAQYFMLPQQFRVPSFLPQFTQYQHVMPQENPLILEEQQQNELQIPSNFVDQQRNLEGSANKDDFQRHSIEALDQFFKQPQMILMNDLVKKQEEQQNWDQNNQEMK